MSKDNKDKKKVRRRYMVCVCVCVSLCGCLCGCMKRVALSNVSVASLMEKKGSRSEHEVFDSEPSSVMP